MQKIKIRQADLVFYKLYQGYKANTDKYLSAWEFGGELYISELKKWEIMSYKCPARLSELYSEKTNIDKLIDRKMVSGKSGSSYYAYKLTRQPRSSDFTDQKLSKFFSLITK